MLRKIIRNQRRRAFGFAPVLAGVLISGQGFISRAAEKSPPPVRNLEKEQALLKDIRVPDGFDATIFATPPAVNYPVFVSAAPDGTVYISSDKNGSLDRAPHRGRVLRARDLDGDGHADEVKAYVPDVDSPRGLVWDRDRLYLMHPPNLSTFIDHDGDGVADEEKVLVKGIAFSFKDRPADHSSNGLELGIDGWIYCAIGDFGFMQAEGTDGRKLQLRGGGVVRVRPDGSGLELYSHGTRNILEAAVSPKLDIFARDNTNDGGGWDVRFHHFAGGSEHGYPSLFQHFPGEFLEPLADFGGGSGCGSLFLSEPGFPEGFNNCVYSCDWGREWVYRLPLAPNGASFTVQQKEFFRAPRVTDVDVDASSHLYVSSWKGATFTYVGEDVGFLARVTPKGYVASPVPDFRKQSVSELLKELDSESHRRCQAAQRELLARGVDQKLAGELDGIASDKGRRLETRIAALFALKQGIGVSSHEILAKLCGDPTIREYAIRALCDRLEELQGIPVELIRAGLSDSNPRVRTQAAYALARLGAKENAVALTALLGDGDAVVAHTATQALKRLDGAEACFAVLDKSSASPQVTGALRVLQSLHEPSVVEGLIERLKSEQEEGKRRGILTALCRLYFRDGKWKGDSWGTRPDTSGPYYQPEEWSETPKIAAVLKSALESAKGPEAAYLVTAFARHKIESEETLETVVALASKDESVAPAAMIQLARADQAPASALRLLTRVADDSSADEATRANAVIALSKMGGKEAALAMLRAMPEIHHGRNGSRETALARQAFLHSRKAAQDEAVYIETAAKLDPKSSPWADAVLLTLSERRKNSGEPRELAKQALAEGWKEPHRRAQILEAIALSQNRGSRELVLEGAHDPDPVVAAAAMRAARALRMEKEIERRSHEPQIATLKVPDVIASVMKTKGEVKAGEELFTRQGCVACHTVSPDQPLRGPYLGNIATIYKRDELAAAVLTPNKTIAQGFATHHFELKDGTEMDGFVIQEAADKVRIRNVTAQEIEIPTRDIAKRSKLETSLMPEGLAANLSVKEFASLIDYLESLSKKN
jgi:putative membrane-bound dehydrogenase-like protein